MLCVSILQAEETKVLRLQLELSQVKADMDRRMQEKEEEFEATRYLLVNVHVPYYPYIPSTVSYCHSVL